MTSSPLPPGRALTGVPSVFTGTVGDLAARLLGATGGGSRFLLGLAGEPGAGKSTVAAQLAEALGAMPSSSRSTGSTSPAPCSARTRGGGAAPWTRSTSPASTG